MRKVSIALALAASVSALPPKYEGGQLLRNPNYWAVGKEPWQGQGKRKMPRQI